jgi:hypothetical protein
VVLNILEKYTYTWFIGAALARIGFQAWLELAAQMFPQNTAYPHGSKESLTMPHNPNKTFFVKREGSFSCFPSPAANPFQLGTFPALSRAPSKV